MSNLPRPVSAPATPDLEIPDMPGPKGCFKSCGIGCAAIAALLVIGGVIIASLAWKALNGDGDGRSATVMSSAAPAGAVSEPMGERAARLTTAHGGRVLLVLGEGEFHLRPAKPGEGLHARAEYDSTLHRLTERFSVLPDSTWEYHLDCRRIQSGSFLRQIFGGERSNAKVYVYLPPDVPVDLDLQARRGGCVADLGGLWLRTGDIRFDQGGMELEFSSPLREPMESLRLQARMGGIEASRVGNASPRALDVDCAMGGGEIDLRGAWRGDCVARASARMGGVAIKVPPEMRVEGHGAGEPSLTGSQTEVPAPVLRLTASATMGEVEVIR